MAGPVRLYREVWPPLCPSGHSQGKLAESEAGIYPRVLLDGYPAGESVHVRYAELRRLELWAGTV